MADKDYSQLASATTAADTDLLAVYPSGGPLKKYTFASFIAQVVTRLGATYLQVTNNLSDLASASSARANLGLGSAATLASTALFQVANNLSEVASAATLRTNIGALAAINPQTTGAGASVIDGATSTTLDCTVADYCKRSISANTTFTLTGGTSGLASSMLLELTISSSAAPTFTGVKWDSGVQQIAANGRNLFVFIWNGTDWTGILVSAAIA